jgi:isomerase DpgB
MVKSTEMNTSDHEGAASVVRLDFSSSLPLTAQLVAQIHEACDGIDECVQEQRILVMRIDGGQPPSWPGATVGLVTKWEQALRRVERLNAVTVAIAQGLCTGAGFELLLTADFRVMDHHGQLKVPVFAGHPWPGMGLYRVAQQAGVGRARGWTLFGRELSADSAARMGLIDEVSRDIAASIASVPERFQGLKGKDVAVHRQLLFEASMTAYETALGTHMAAAERILRSVGTT